MIKENVHEIDKIMDITNCIVETVHPQKVILFGSFARGEDTKNSDYDLFIICDDKDHDHFSKQGVAVHMALWDFDERGIDVIFNTKEKFEDYKLRRARVDYYVNKEGITLYEQ